MPQAPQNTKPAADPAAASTVDPSMAPQMPKGEVLPPKHHSHLGMWILGMVMMVLILALVGVAIYLVQGTSDAQIAEGEAQSRISELETDLAEAQSEIQAKDMEIEELQNTEEEATTRQYNGVKYSFNYLNGWHIYGVNSYDDPNRTAPQFTAMLGPEPIVNVSPRGGGQLTPFYFSVADEGENLVEKYTSNELLSVDAETTVVNNQDAVLLTILPSTDAAYAPQYQEVLIVGDVEVSYAYSDGYEYLEAWDMIKNSILVK